MRKHMPYIVLAAGVLTSCGTPAARDAARDSALPEVVAKALVSAENGGTLEVTEGQLKGTKLVVPAGAVDRDVIVTVSTVVRPAPNDSTAAVEAGPAAKFEPAGLQFKKPVEIRLPYSLAALQKEGLTAKHAAVHYFNPEAKIWQALAPTPPHGETAGALIEHFSIYRIYGLTVFADSPHVDRVRVEPAHRYLLPGQTFDLSAKAYSASGAEIAGVAVAWASSNPAVATVSDAGRVTAHALGAAEISATADGQTGDARIEVVTRIPVGPPPQVIYLSPTYYGGWGEGGRSASCDDAYNDTTGSFDVTSCPSPFETVLFTDAATTGEVILYIHGSNLFGQDGPSAAPGDMRLYLPLQSGGSAMAEVAEWEDFSTTTPGSYQSVGFRVPVSTSTGTAYFTSPGGEFHFSVRLWSKPVVRYVYPDVVSPCHLSGEGEIYLTGNNLGAGTTVAIGGYAVDVTWDRSDYGRIAFSSAIPSGDVVATNALGASSAYTETFAETVPAFLRYEGPVVFGAQPAVVVNETTVTVSGCGFEGGVVERTALPLPGDMSPWVGQTVAASLGATQATFSAPLGLYYYAVTRPGFPRSELFPVVTANAELWSHPHYTDFTAHGGYFYAAGHDAPCEYGFCTGNDVLVRVNSLGNVSTAVSDRSLDGYRFVFSPNGTLFAYTDFWHSDNFIYRLSADFTGGVLTFTQIYTVEGGRILDMLASDTALFWTMEYWDQSGSTDLLRGTHDGYVPHWLGTLSPGDEISLFGTHLYILRTYYWDILGGLFALRVDASDLSAMTMVVAVSGNGYTDEAGAVAMYHNPSEARLYVHHKALFGDPVGLNGVYQNRITDTLLRVIDPQTVVQIAQVTTAYDAWEYEDLWWAHSDYWFLNSWHLRYADQTQMVLALEHSQSYSTGTFSTQFGYAAYDFADAMWSPKWIGHEYEDRSAIVQLGSAPYFIRRERVSAGYTSAGVALNEHWITGLYQKD
jgi:hypothetical protein